MTPGKRTLIRLCSAILYTASAVILVMLVKALFFSGQIQPVLTKTVLCAAYIVTFYFSRFLFAFTSVGDNRRRMMRRGLIITLAVYLLFIADVTLFDPALGRFAFTRNIFASGALSDPVYAEKHLNYIPFSMIWKMLTVYPAEYGTGFVAVNLAGNFAVLMPVALLLTLILPERKRTLRSILLCFGISVIIELLQLIFMTGTCDIDDVILNTAGAAVICLLMKVPVINGIIRKATMV